MNLVCGCVLQNIAHILPCYSGTAEFGGTARALAKPNPGMELWQIELWSVPIATNSPYTHAHFQASEGTLQQALQCPPVGHSPHTPITLRLPPIGHQNKPLNRSVLPPRWSCRGLWILVKEKKQTPSPPREGYSDECR